MDAYARSQLYKLAFNMVIWYCWYQNQAGLACAVFLAKYATINFPIWIAQFMDYWENEEEHEHLD